LTFADSEKDPKDPKHKNVAFLWYLQAYKNLMKAEKGVGSQMGLEGDKDTAFGAPIGFQLNVSPFGKKGKQPDLNVTLRFVINLDGNLIPPAEVTEVYSFADKFRCGLINRGMAPNMWSDVYYEQETEFFNMLQSLFPMFVLCAQNYLNEDQESCNHARY
jgi:hypothetical protein